MSSAHWSGQPKSSRRDIGVNTPTVTTFINISKRDLGALKKREEKKNKSKRTNVPT
jgi:hypothetical protein